MIYDPDLSGKQNVWQKTTLTSGNWDSSRQLWVLNIRQDGEEERSISCSYVVLAGGGGSQIPVMPEYPNRVSFSQNDSIIANQMDLFFKNIFEGIALHSVEYKDASKWKEKRGVVVGTANTGNWHSP